jgi:hypothetical protein
MCEEEFRRLWIINCLYVWAPTMVLLAIVCACNKRTVFLVCVEDYVRFVLCYFFGPLLIGCSFGAFDFLVCKRKINSLIFHIVASYFPGYFIWLILFHLFVNLNFPNYKMDLMSYFLENSSVQEEPQLFGSFIEPNFTGDKFKCRRSQMCYGFGSKDYRPLAFSPNYHNELSSIKHRICKQTIPINDVLTPICINWVKRNIRHLLPISWQIKSVSFDQYLKRSNASPAVKRKLLLVKQRLMSDSIDETSKLSYDQVRRWTTRKMFVKVENNLYRSPGGILGKAPRPIQGAY